MMAHFNIFSWCSAHWGGDIQGQRLQTADTEGGRKHIKKKRKKTHRKIKFIELRWQKASSNLVTLGKIKALPKTLSFVRIAAAYTKERRRNSEITRRALKLSFSIWHRIHREPAKSQIWKTPNVCEWNLNSIYNSFNLASAAYNCFNPQEQLAGTKRKKTTTYLGQQQKGV